MLILSPQYSWEKKFQILTDKQIKRKLKINNQHAIVVFINKNMSKKKTVFPKAFDFCEILKMHEKIFENARIFFLLFYCVQRTK